MNELKNTNNNDPGQVKTDLSQLDLINELEDRQRRSNNLILNIPESDKETSILRRDDDLTRCKEILTHNIQGDVTYEIMSCYRLGKFVVNKSRPLKITLATQSQALEVLKKYKQTDGHYLNRDLTPYQRNVCYLVRKELRQRKENGESNLKLAYLHGIPKIVVQNKDNITVRKN
ncbi:hypothetical protein Zmor_026960 [Zophobas morio]|uniref:Uncharacterized protein n=1 Tax=Zophobas morio TaxID=2755281 RepID=A0AA38I0F1_9CUCU|nr:hypothetical protein Zmor_026960 [Zophobas morio]